MYVATRIVIYIDTNVLDKLNLLFLFLKQVLFSDIH